MKADLRAELRLEASTVLGAADCFDLVRSAAEQAKPGANYAGQGLSLVVVGDPQAGAIINMGSKSGKVCDFAALFETSNGQTDLVVGGLNEYQVIKHTVMLVPVGSEILGYGYYKRFLAQVEAMLRHADPHAGVTVGIPGAQRVQSA